MPHLSISSPFFPRIFFWGKLFVFKESNPFLGQLCLWAGPIGEITLGSPGLDGVPFGDGTATPRPQMVLESMGCLLPETAKLVLQSGCVRVSE